MIDQITAAEARNRILASNGKFFSVIVKTKTKGLTQMTARLGVTKGITGEGRKFVPGPELISVFSTDRNGYRFINWPGIKQLAIDGKTFVVK